MVDIGVWMTDTVIICVIASVIGIVFLRWYWFALKEYYGDRLELDD